MGEKSTPEYQAISSNRTEFEEQLSPHLKPIAKRLRDIKLLTSDECDSIIAAGTSALVERMLFFVKNNPVEMFNEFIHELNSIAAESRPLKYFIDKIETKKKEGYRNLLSATSAPASGRSYDVFISYGREPQTYPYPTVNLLSTLLKKEGLNVFVDAKSLKPGDRWPAKIADAIHTSKAFVAILTKKYVKSLYCHGELYEAEAIGNKLLFPVVLETGWDKECAGMPIKEILGSIHYIMCNGDKEDHDSELQKLVKTIKDKIQPSEEKSIGTRLGSKQVHDSNDYVEQLNYEIKSMERKFAKLLTETRESIKTRKVHPKALVAHLVAYRTFPAVLKKEDKLLADRQEELETADSIDKIFVVVSPFWSFLDFEILEDIINHKDLGADNERKILAEYITTLKKFLEFWKVKPTKIFCTQNELSKSRKKLQFKLDTDSLSVYRDVKAAIARILCIQVYALQLHSIKDGCIELVFLLPVVAIKALVPLDSTTSSMLSLVKPQIVRITLQDENASEAIFKAIAPASLLDFEIHFEVLCEQLDEVKILPYLRAGALLASDAINALCSIQDDHKKRHYLCTQLLHRCRYLGFAQFAYCLVWSGQTALAERIGVDVQAIPSCPYDDSWISGERELLLSFGCIKRHQLKPQLDFSWRVKKSTPFEMGLIVKSIVIKDVQYVGGGYADSNNLAMCTVMKFDLKENEWSRLPQYCTTLFAMTSLSNQLILVGGNDPETFCPKNQVAKFSSNKWTTLYPPMNTARSCASAVSCKNRIIVAGGYTPNPVSEYLGLGGCISSNSVEVFDPILKIWYYAQSLPAPVYIKGSALVGDTLYIKGGTKLNPSDSASARVVYKVDMNELVQTATSRTAVSTTSSTLWQTIKDTHLQMYALLGLGGSLLSFGGCDVGAGDDDYDIPNSSIFLYQPDFERWVKVGDLPTARYGCACSVLSNGEIAVIGGFAGGTFLGNLDFVSITTSF